MQVYKQGLFRNIVYASGGSLKKERKCTALTNLNNSTY